MNTPTTTAGAPRSNGIDLILYCTLPIPEGEVLQVLELLASRGFHTDMFVDSDLAQQANPDGVAPHYSVVPPEFMGDPMSTMDEIREWLDRISTAITPGSI